MIELWQALIAAVAAAVGGGGLHRLLMTGSDIGKRNVESAVVLMEAYGEQLDRHKADIERLTEQATAQQKQIAELLGLVRARDEQILSLRAENTRLRDRVEDLERRPARRYDDPDHTSP